MEIYTCSMCGITSETHKNWGPICPRKDARVCDECCYHCENHKATCPGTWMCTYKTYEQRMDDARKRIRDRENQEIARISKEYHRQRKEKARQWAIKRARAEAKRKREQTG